MEMNTIQCWSLLIWMCPHGNEYNTVLKFTDANWFECVPMKMNTIQCWSLLMWTDLNVSPWKWIQYSAGVYWCELIWMCPHGNEYNAVLKFTDVNWFFFFFFFLFSFFFSLTWHCIYPKYLDTLKPYHTCPKIWTSPFEYLLMCLKLLYGCSEV